MGREATASRGSVWNLRGPPGCRVPVSQCVVLQEELAARAFLPLGVAKGLNSSTEGSRPSLSRPSLPCPCWLEASCDGRSLGSHLGPWVEPCWEPWSNKTGGRDRRGCGEPRATCLQALAWEETERLLHVSLLVRNLCLLGQKLPA